MRAYLLAVLCAAVAAGLCADEPKAETGQPPHEISMEVQALRAFDRLALKDEQLKLLAKFAKETGEPERKRTPPKASDKYVQLLKDVRDALIAEDVDKADELDEELGQLQDDEKAEIDDGFDATKAARKRAPEVFKTFKVYQLASFYGSIADDVIDPLAHLTTSLATVRGYEKGEWRDQRDAIADEVAWGVAGADLAKWEKVSDKVVSLLSKARSLTDDEFKAQKADLEKTAKEIVNDVGPDVILRHNLERTLAELLSNPRLEAAVKARLK